MKRILLLAALLTFLAALTPVSAIEYSSPQIIRSHVAADLELVSGPGTLAEFGFRPYNDIRIEWLISGNPNSFEERFDLLHTQGRRKEMFVGDDIGFDWYGRANGPSNSTMAIWRRDLVGDLAGWQAWALMGDPEWGFSDRFELRDLTGIHESFVFEMTNWSWGVDVVGPWTPGSLTPVPDSSSGMFAALACIGGLIFVRASRQRLLA